MAFKDSIYGALTREENSNLYDLQEWHGLAMSNYGLDPHENRWWSSEYRHKAFLGGTCFIGKCPTSLQLHGMGLTWERGMEPHSPDRKTDD